MKKIFIVLIFLIFTHSAQAATEFVSVIDTGAASDSDFSSLSAWQSIMTNSATDLTSANTQVFSGTTTGVLGNNITVYQCRGTAYHGVTGSMVYDTKAGQALVKSITGGASFQSNDFWNVSSTCTSPTNFFTISNTGDSAIAVAKCRTTTGAADTVRVSINGWTTSADNYIKIWTDPNESYRHQGKWDNNKYRLEYTAVNYYPALFIGDRYVRIDGLQILLVSNGQNNRGCINSQDQEAGAQDVRISNNILKIDLSGGGSAGGINDSGAGISKIWNNIIYNGTSGLFTDKGNNASYIYNNTVYNCTTGYWQNSGYWSIKYSINNIAQNCTDGFYGTFADSSDYNISDLASDTPGNPGTYNKNSTVVSFASTTSGSEDFHLSAADTSAKDYGTNQVSEIGFTTDIDEKTRPYPVGGNWDVGADEYMVPPVLTEITPVPTPILDGTPDYTFNSTTGGTISYGGSCSSTETSAIEGNNTITFNHLAPGTYSNCTIQVTDVFGQTSNLFSVTSFNVGGATINSPNLPPGSKMTINVSQADKMTNGLIGMWSFDGPDINIATNTAYDRGSGGHNGTIANASPMPGKNGQALDFNGTTSYASCGNVGNGIKTISFWMKADDIMDRKIIDIDGTRQIEINGSSQIVATNFPAATVYVDGAAGSTINSDWHHITIVDSTGINGSAVDLGRVSSGYFDGRLDEVRFYNRDFSTQEVGDLYRLGHVKIVQ